MARLTRRSGNLPAEATSFVGRRRELTELRKKLGGARLVSLVGPGGVGKTRLAIRGASDLVRRFPGGAWLVELADLRDPSLVGNAFLVALDLRDQAATNPLALLLSYLRDKELLLVVDNCEHLLEAATHVVTAVLKAAPGVRVIATTREPLAADGENVIPVPPFELPPSEHGGAVDQSRHNDAVLLFIERAAAASGRFELTQANEAAVVDLCRRLDGLPLAIELAAVRTRVLTMQQILDRLTDRFGLLTGGSKAAVPRHQTLRTTIDWSHDLLSTDEQTAIRRLSGFAGRFTLEDVESVCAFDDFAPAHALDSLSSLVEKSMVAREDAKGVPCYRLHETMREYAGLKLKEAREEEIVATRCVEYFMARGRRSAGEARSELLAWLRWMELEIDNVRSVLQRCLHDGEVQHGIDLASSLGWYWITRASTEGVRWLEQLLAAGDGDAASHPHAHFMRGFLAVVQVDPESARPALKQAIAAARQRGQLRLLARALATASIAENMAGDRGSAKRLLDEAQAISAGVNHLSTRLTILQAWALDGFFRGDLGAVASASSEGARISRESGDIYTLENMLIDLGFATLIAGDLNESRPYFTEALEVASRIDDRVIQFYAYGGLGCQAAGSGEPRLAAQLLGAADKVRAEVGLSVMTFLGPVLAEATHSASARLGASKFASEFGAGRRLDRDAALALVLHESPKATAPASDQHSVGFLGKREAEVARLVAEGLTNKQIGARLFISDRTVGSHVRSILNKLGVNSRAQIAAWMASASSHH